MLKPIDAFLADGIPAVLAGKPKVHALLATYNTVSHYPNGSVQIKPGLTIQVQSGNLEYTDASLIFVMQGMVGDFTSANLGHHMMEREARTALQVVEEGLELHEEAEATLVAVVYAGYSAFRESIKVVRSIRAQHPKAHIVVTTCTCNLEHKEPVLESMLERGEIQTAVVTEECQGRMMMGNILEAIVAAWPEQVASQ